MSKRVAIKSSVFHTPWAEYASIELESNTLSVSVLPQFGGKIVSIRRKADSAEFLLAAQQPYRTPALDDSFASSDLGGFDECFPSVNLVKRANRYDIPDHGDLWRRPWTIEEAADSLLLGVDAVSVPARLRRRLSVDDGIVTLDYELTNTGKTAFSYLYAAHPLFRVEDGDRILLPQGINQVRLEGWTLDERAKNSVLTWPVAALHSAQTEYDLSLIRPLSENSAAKIFAGPLRLGRAGLYRSQLRVGITVSFDPQYAPYLGIWISHGAWPFEQRPTSHYTVALEPTTAPCDSIEEAEKEGTCRILGANATVRWRTSFSVSPFDDCKQFQDFVDYGHLGPI